MNNRYNYRTDSPVHAILRSELARELNIIKIHEDAIALHFDRIAKHRMEIKEVTKRIAVIRGNP